MQALKNDLAILRIVMVQLAWLLLLAPVAVPILIWRRRKDA
jgi:hypothetical protein